MGTADDGLASFQIRPSFEQKFRPSKVKDIIHNILVEELGGKTYKEVLPRKEAIIEQVLKQVKDVVFERYKVVVQITLGEQRGAGVKVVSNCCWDKDTDNYASDVFLNDSLFCIVTVFGLYHY